MPAEAFIAPLDAHPERLSGGAGRVGRHIARTQAMGALNQRAAYRAVAGGGPGPEGNITKLVLYLELSGTRRPPSWPNSRGRTRPSSDGAERDNAPC